jgi:sensor c-di-GMP phosphodiesterase-like protein
VETEAQRDYLVAQGCPACQGFLFSPPLEIEALERFMENIEAQHDA